VTLLGQQELMTLPPRRRLIAPPGCATHWGVDPSTVRLSIAWVRDTGVRGVVTDSHLDLKGASRLHAIYETTRRLAVLAPHPGLVLVEQPSGKFDNLELVFAVGATLAGLASALGPRVTIETCTSSWWKKRACGRGNIYKPTRKSLGRKPEYEDYGVAVWARENGYAGSLWDEADAWGIAEAARREVLLEER
jgi:hypothetical protein